MILIRKFFSFVAGTLQFTIGQTTWKLSFCFFFPFLAASHATRNTVYSKALTSNYVQEIKGLHQNIQRKKISFLFYLVQMSSFSTSDTNKPFDKTKDSLSCIYPWSLMTFYFLIRKIKCQSCLTEVILRLFVSIFLEISGVRPSVNVVQKHLVFFSPIVLANFF